MEGTYSAKGAARRSLRDNTKLLCRRRSRFRIQRRASEAGLEGVWGVDEEVVEGRGGGACVEFGGAVEVCADGLGEAAADEGEG